ncbi:WD40 repeat domain-containing protein [Microtetraspora malaysiensis]|uniref:WD40 repeat domain-containing protein n=1 Tax=Microtetraspora malaysiensis TaxID=161358 RepID=A0ABW6SYB9_9ACTN
MLRLIRIAAGLLLAAGGALLIWPHTTDSPILYGRPSGCGGPEGECGGWDLRLASGETLTLPYAAERPEIAISADGHHVVYLDLAERRVLARDLRDGAVHRVTPALTPERAADLTQLTVSGDGRLFAVSSAEGTRVTDSVTGPTRTLKGLCTVSALTADLVWGTARCGPGGWETDMLVAVRRDGTGFFVGDVDGGAALSPDGGRLLTYSFDGPLIVDAVTGKKVALVKKLYCGDEVVGWLNDHELVCEKQNRYGATDIATWAWRPLTTLPNEHVPYLVLGSVEQ